MEYYLKGTKLGIYTIENELRRMEFHVVKVRVGVGVKISL
jgi:hypothetical protein